jgi:prolyl-tRNA synthetase
MRMTRCHFATLREFPADAEVISHKLMAKAGLILKTGSGIYSYAPIFLRTLRKIMRIVSEEMDRAGAQEMLMPIAQPQELWERSGRLENYIKSGILWRAQDRKGGWFALGPTHEEVITDFVGRTLNSYKQLPQILYQQQDKFRDELRPRFGLMRGREFIMKDAYSFDADEAGLDASYRKMREAYFKIFKRCGLEFIVVQADAGQIGGTGSEEFMVTADAGEDQLLYCGCGYAANVEKASSRTDAPYAAEPKPMHKEPTPGVKTVGQLCGFFPDLTPARMVKTILYNATFPGKAEFETVGVLMRGDQDINEVKLINALGALTVELADEDTVRRVTQAEVGFAGPVGFVQGEGYRIRLIADRTVRGMTNFLCGCNTTDFHSLDVNFGRDIPEPAEYHDVRLARVGEPCPVCGGPLKTARGIEVGHIFKLGTKYTVAMNATFLDENGKSQPFIMGCYGIGSSRIAAAAVEQRHDDKGICWPVTIAPYHVHLLGLNMKDEAVKSVGEAIYQSRCCSTIAMACARGSSSRMPI